MLCGWEPCDARLVTRKLNTEEKARFFLCGRTWPLFFLLFAMGSRLGEAIQISLLFIVKIDVCCRTSITCASCAIRIYGCIAKENAHE